MATIAEQLTSLANTKTAIKDAIVAKGVQVADDTPFSGYADKIGEISGGGEPVEKTRFGASIDTWLGDVDENGVLKKTTWTGALNFAGINTVDIGGMYYAFSYCSGITSVDLSSLQSIGSNGMFYAFRNCSGITSVDLSSLQSVGSSGMYYAFSYCSGITSVDLSSLQSIGSNGMYSAFSYCSSIVTISFPSLTDVQSNSFGSSIYGGIFYGCTKLAEIHFRADMQATIEAMSAYADKWGATNATIYFDL